MTSFSAIIFDLDGVLADTESLQLQAINTVLRPLGLTLNQEEYAKSYVGIPIEQDLRHLLAEFQLPMSLAELAARRQAVYAELLKNGSGLKPEAGLVPFLDQLDERGIPFGIASGSPMVDVQEVLHALKLEKRFRCVTSGDQVVNSKPAPDVYLLAATRLGISPEQCLAIEDSRSGIASAKAAQMRVIAIPSPFTRYQDLTSADERVADFYELRRLLFDKQTPQ